MTITFSLGSNSSIKSKALENALDLVGLRSVVSHQCKVSSGVNAQPVGIEEIAAGAHNRAIAAMESVPGSLGIGIESGIIFEDGVANNDDLGWSDIAMVVVMLPDGREFTRWSQSVRFPLRFVLDAKDRGFATWTVGQVIAMERGGDASDPLRMVTGGKVTRKKTLTDALVAVLTEAMAGARDIFGEPVAHFDISFGDVRRRLPVREVAPGVRVALFNILGDWELTEAAGKALANKMYDSAMKGDTLVMPDGKAIALLHVLGRELQLQTFVARKERKPYMGDTVRSVSYRSITTNREQSLFLSADDAAALKGKHVIVVDDVISTGGSIDATKALMAAVGARVAGVATIFCEGKDRPDVCSLGLLPLF